MEFLKIQDNKKQYLHLLLLADEQEDMIDRYLEEGDMYALFDDGLKAVSVVVIFPDGSCELKNLATDPGFQGKGYGKAMVAYLFDRYQDTCTAMLVGTGDNPNTVGFYRACGFRDSHRVKNFFTDHYNHPIIEDGIQLVDMVYLKKDFSKE